MTHKAFFRLAKPIMERLKVDYAMIRENKPGHAHKRGNLYSALIASDPENVGVNEIAKHYGVPKVNVANDLNDFRQKL